GCLLFFPTRRSSDLTWITEPGKNLTFSIGLKPHFLDPKKQFFLSMAISLGLLDGLTSLLPKAEVRIKWPNDMMLNDKKTCGILIDRKSTRLNSSHVK